MRALLDWKLITAAIVLLVVSWFVYSGYRAQVDASDKGERINRLISLVESQQDSQQKARRDARQERRELLEAQKQLMRQFTQLEEDVAP